jgi:hypothetical protein
MGVLLAGVLLAGGVLAGELTPPGPPGGTMRTLQEIYDKIEAIGGYVGFTGGDAAAGEILSGKKAWVGGAEVTGTMANVGQTNMSPGTAAKPIPQGYHDGTGTVAGDADLAAGNIKKAVTIFGVTGSYEGGGSVTYNAAVRKTGQTTSYSPGDDGDLEKGVAWPNPRFTDNANGTVTDNLTGLMWTKNAFLPGGTLSWSNAINYCTGMNADAGTYGYTDWRLPNVLELQSLMDYERFNPASLPLGHPFTGVSPNFPLYWTASTFAPSTGNAWLVSLASGMLMANAKMNDCCVWPVRGGP